MFYWPCYAAYHFPKCHSTVQLTRVSIWDSCRDKVPCCSSADAQKNPLIKRITVRGQPGQTIPETPTHLQKNRAKWTGGVAQEESTCFASMKIWVQTPVQKKKSW
jgi:hypothetical protein